jgi:hypothetical protein
MTGRQRHGARPANKERLAL